MNKNLAIVTIVCITFSMVLLYACAYTVRGEELTFTAEGNFDRVVFKKPNALVDLNCIYEDGGSFQYLTGGAPGPSVFLVVVYTSDNNYIDYIYTAPLESKTFDIGGVQITVENNYEDIGVINPLELIIVIFGGISIGIFLVLTVVSWGLASRGIHLWN